MLMKWQLVSKSMDPFGLPQVSLASHSSPPTIVRVAVRQWIRSWASGSLELE